MRSSIRRWLSHRRAPLVIVVLFVALASPALTVGFTGDDYYHRLVLTGPSGIEAIPADPGQLFIWADGNADRAHGMMEVGMTAWWTDPDLVMAYFRPVSALTHRLDYALWPNNAFLMHAHSLLWFVLALWGLSRLYRRWLGDDAPAWLPTLALLLFAIDDAHGMALGWIANRNALVALAVAVPVLSLHDRAAREGDRLAMLAGPPLLLLALLSGEAALAITTYLFAYALFLDPGGPRRGLLRIVPHAVFALGWAIYYRASGYGARGSGLVMDPGGEPLRYLAKLAERLPVMLAAELGFPPSDGWEAYPAVTKWLPAAMFAWALLTLVLFALAFVPQLRRRPAARAFALGMMLSGLPVAAQFPHDRLLLFVGVGGAGLLAGLVAEVIGDLRPQAPALGRRMQRAMGWAAVVLHLGIAPLWLPLRVRAPLDGERMMDQADRSIDRSESVRGRTVVLINPPMDAYAGYIPPKREALGIPRPRAIRWLATASSDVTVTREDARTLRVRPEHGFLRYAFDRMQRDPRNVMPVGYRVRFSDVEIEVTALTDDDRPAEIVARFDQPLEEGPYEFLKWGERRFVPFALPAVGERVTLPEVDFTTLLP
ncbi:MAG: hypothetical protein PVI30_25665 [Myxococcales bacterium]|jgi:hypothetical protein